MANTEIRNEQIDSEGATDGYILTADGSGGADWEANAGTGSGYTQGARVYNSSNISVNHDTPTDLTFNSERYDTDSIHDTSSNTERLTCQTTGVYIISATIEFAYNATGYRYLAFYLNNTTLIAIQQANTSANIAVRLSLTTIYQLSATNYVTCRVYQNSTGSLNVTTQSNRSPEFMMQRIG